MFYSHDLLAPKASLGTVWLAAHIQHRLKEEQYTATKIPIVVDEIMFCKAPMSLRVSGPLLHGVVRIYSKKLDFLFRDYNRLATCLAKVFVNKVDLPENVRVAPIELVTLPETLNLDEFDLENDDILLDMEFDYHLANMEDITLTDQIPNGIDPYVAITFDEDITPESSNPMDIDQSTELVNEPDYEMAYETGPNNELRDFNIALETGTYDIPQFEFFHDPRPSNSTEALNASSPRNVPEIEKGRNREELSPMSHPPFVTQQQNDRIEHTVSLDEILNEKEHTIPIIDEEQVLHSPRNSTLSPRFASYYEEERSNFVHPSPQLALQPTPSSPPPQARLRKRKYFDKVTVLSNDILKESLKNPSDTLRKRKKILLSKLDIWRLNQSKTKDQIFSEPLFTGFSDVIRSVFEKDCVASKPYLAFHEPTPVSSPIREAETEINRTSPILQSTVPDSTNVDTTFQPSPAQFNNDDIEIERFRDGDVFSSYMMSSPPRSSPFRTNDFTTQPETLTTELMSSPPRYSPSRNNEFTTQPETYTTAPSTSSTNPENLTGLRNSRLSDIPEMAMDEELYFLEVGSNTPVRSPASQDSNALTGRTRALAQYLKEHSSNSPSSPNTSSFHSGDLSLSKILEGKTRKLAARRFYETMVLKSRGLIDVQQDQPYGDIALKLLPSLFSKVQL